MIGKTALAALCALLLASCAPVPSKAPSPPTAEDEDAPSGLGAAQPESPPVIGFDARTMKCSVLNSASDDDKAYAASFLLGYRSALAHQHTIDTKRIEAVEIAALADCAARPDAFASKVFATAMIKVRPEVETGSKPSTLPPPRRVHRRVFSPAAVPAEVMPQPVPPAPDQSPPMQYTPAPTKPPAEAPAKPAAETPPPPAETPAPAKPAAEPPTPPPAEAPAKPSAETPPPPATTPAPAEKPAETPPSETPKQ